VDHKFISSMKKVNACFQHTELLIAKLSDLWVAHLIEQVSNYLLRTSLLDNHLQIRILK
jgi:hypothetical protein